VSTSQEHLSECFQQTSSSINGINILSVCGKT